MEAAESPLDVLSRAAVMIQRNVLPPPSYDEARSLSQQQKQKLQRRYKTSGLSDDSDDSNLGISSSYDIANTAVATNSASGKWKREKKYQHKTPVAVSACDSTLNGYKVGVRYNGRSSNGTVENGSEPLDMSKRSTIKDRGEPPSYFQSILCSNYGLRLNDPSKPVVTVQEDKSRPSSTTTTTTDDKESTMCDQVINEHFRRSLGRDYANVFSANNKSKTAKRSRTNAAAAAVDDEKNSDDDATAAAAATTTAAIAAADELDDQSTISRAHRTDDDDDDVDETAEAVQNNSTSTLSVDDHFAKALGDTWIKLQQQEKRYNRNQNTNRADDED